jgi:ABC-2 type transport system ATP-binding protein
MHMLSLRGVRKSFGAQEVLKDLDLTVPERSIYGFLGNNGEGKSTTIRLVTGLMAADAGEIEVLGLNVRSKRMAILAQLGALVEAPSLYPNLTAGEFLQIGQLLKNLPRSEIARVLELVSLSGARDRRISAFSLGMKQRLAIAHALLGSPKLLVLDEPTNGLDPEGIRDIRTLLKSLPENAGTTVFVSSHNLDEVEKTATHVGVLRGGSLKFEGSMDQLAAIHQGSLLLDVGDDNLAVSLLGGAGYDARLVGESQVQVHAIGPRQGDRVHAILVGGGVSLYQSVYRTPTLEEWFLEAGNA